MWVCRSTAHTVAATQADTISSKVSNKYCEFGFNHSVNWMSSVCEVNGQDYFYTVCQTMSHVLLLPSRLHVFAIKTKTTSAYYILLMWTGLLNFNWSKRTSMVRASSIKCVAAAAIQNSMRRHFEYTVDKYSWRRFSIQRFQSLLIQWAFTYAQMRLKRCTFLSGFGKMYEYVLCCRRCRCLRFASPYFGHRCRRSQQSVVYGLMPHNWTYTMCWENIEFNLFFSYRIGALGVSTLHRTRTLFYGENRLNLSSIILKRVAR